VGVAGRWGNSDGTRLRKRCSRRAGPYVVPHGHEHPWHVGGRTFRQSIVGACLKPGRLIELKESPLHTRGVWSHQFMCCLAKGYQNPL